MDYKKVGLFIHQKRIDKGFTQQSLADELYLDTTTISKWERGVAFPDSGIITKLCSLLGINEHELFLACEDQDYRNAKKKLYEISKGKTIAFYIITGLYLLAVLTCFICNLAVDHKLNWFFIVLFSCLCGWTFFPTGIRFFRSFKLEGFIISTFISLCLLFLTCSIYTNNNWCFIAIISSLLGYFLFFFPFIFFKKEYIRIPHKYFLLMYSIISLGLLIGLLFVINEYTIFNLILALQISIYSFIPLILASIIVIIPLNKSLKSSLIVFESGLFCYSINYVLNSLLDPYKKDVYKIDFSNWKLYSNGNVSIIILITSLLVFTILLLIGIFKKKTK